jgi:DNA polymerase-3 subunit gamma/tau
VVTALYRRYRPENFAELIGQSQVTAPLMAALRADRVNHAYLFSGPRGCGKTTSARILARCLNCAEGPTDTPCGKCDSCVELARDGGGSLDVVEIDAASHNGVDDARELRERAGYAPARDRYKIFILDEAHMVTPQGFNALLKIVEEPPAHVKFIFATTEPEKVIATIRSRTHHYPFRLVPPAQMIDYLEEVCASEKVEIAPGVMPLVVRSGGGSVRDSLSLLDQLIAGSEGRVEYDRAVALLGYTPESLLDEAVDALAIRDSASAFAAVDKVIQSGQDPRQFVEDLLERLRDIILVASVGAEAKSVLRGSTDDMIDKMKSQSGKFGQAELTHAAAEVNAALSAMSGATSPKLHLELMIAKVLVPGADESEIGSLARIERLERRIGIGEGASPVGAPSPAPEVKAAPAAPASPAPAVEAPVASAPAPVGAVTLTQLKAAWPEILRKVETKSMAAWLVAFGLDVIDFDGDVLTVRFPSQYDLEKFKAAEGAPDVLREAIFEEFGVKVKFKPHLAQPAEPAAGPETKVIEVVPEPAAEPEVEPEPEVVAEPEVEPEDDGRYGASLLREILDAKPLDEK